ncbi:thermonuclease family protein [Halobium salinum]|uniref:Thermonuclease family protein n=1 Tax=Halobium salinum TaxID=1364940 RepID=A0ABD5PHM4_9EURY|nr:thermonuclease family protein [Halobium salinum]
MNGGARSAGGSDSGRWGAVALALLVLLAGCGGPTLAGEVDDGGEAANTPQATADGDGRPPDETTDGGATDSKARSTPGSDRSANPPSPANATDGRDGVSGPDGAKGRNAVGVDEPNATTSVGNRGSATTGATTTPNSTAAGARTGGTTVSGAVGGVGSSGAAGGSGGTSTSPASGPSSDATASTTTTETTTTDGLSPTDTTPDPFPGGRSVTVLRVLDGDTLRVAFDDGATATVDLVGVDAPERYEPQRPAAFPGVPATAAGRAHLDVWGAEAHDALTATAEGERATVYVTAQSNVTRSPASTAGGYDEPEPLLVAYVDVDGRRLNRALLGDGYARATDAGHPRRAAFRADADAARDAGRGLWSASGSL